jgi:heme-degrading monooxygenase HmoA
MILRFFRAIVHDGKQNEFRDFFLGTALPNVRSQAGLVSVFVGLPIDESPTEFSIVMVWRDLNALKGFTGEGWQEAVIHPDEVHMLKETHVHHYDLAQPQFASQ